MTTKTTFMRAREENRMRAAIVNAPKLPAYGLSKEELASLMQQGAIKINQPEPRLRGARGPAPGCGGGPRKFKTEEERVEARKQYVRDYHTKHRERLNEYSREWKRQNREQVKRVKHEYHLKLKAKKLTW